jgi:choloylglycine hydrolase
MKRSIKTICFVMALSTGFLPCAHACTSIRIKTTDGLVFYARTMEGSELFHSSVSVIPKGTKYQGTLPDGTQAGMSWTTRYGMVGMNTYGLPLLSDGMNDAGLAAGNLLFPGFSGYQVFDTKQAAQTVAQYEVITWILSNFATVEEVKEALPHIRVSKGPEALAGNLELHYTVHDSKGNSVVIEYVDGALKIYDNPLGVMTNAPAFDWHLTHLRNYANLSATNAKPFIVEGLKESGLGQGTGMLGLPGDYTPPSRFVRMVALVHSSLPVTGADEGLNLAMTIINNVDIPIGSVRDPGSNEVMYDRTQWTVVSDLARKRFYFRTYGNKDWRMVDVTKALANAQGIMTLPAEMPADYRDVTANAKESGPLPAKFFPAGKP